MQKHVQELYQVMNEISFLLTNKNAALWVLFNTNLPLTVSELNWDAIYLQI